MNADMKYITFEGHAHQEIVIFAPSRHHLDVFNALGIRREDLLGAGFISFRSDTPKCWGQSNNLNISARAFEDTQLFHRLAGLDL